MRKTAIFFIALLLSLSSFGKVLLVSDLDDTIKISGINSLSLYTNYLTGVKPFNHLIDVYKNIIEKYEGEGTPVEVIYLTSSPKLINSKAWLEEHNAPDGRVINRTNKELFYLSGEKFKTRELSKVLKHSDKYSKILLFGDNSEHDPQVYSSVVRELKVDNSEIYIRDVQAFTACDGYESNLIPGINYFLSEFQLIDENNYFDFIDNELRKQIYSAEINDLIPIFVDAQIFEKCGTTYRGLL